MYGNIFLISVLLYMLLQTCLIFVIPAIKMPANDDLRLFIAQSGLKQGDEGSDAFIKKS